MNTKKGLPKFVKKFDSLTENQKIFYDMIENQKNNIVMAHGLAGCGKSYVSIQKGIEHLYLKKYKKVYIIKPTVDVGNEDKLGYLPGQLDEKMNEYFESCIYILKKIIPPEQVTNLVSEGKLDFKVVNFLRGMNLENCYVIIDEAQNLSPLQIKTICTRISDNTKLIIQGDMSQCDKYKGNYEKSGFWDVWYRFKNVEGVDRVEFSPEDCIRSGIVKRILKTYEKDSHVYLNSIDKK